MGEIRFKGLIRLPVNNVRTVYRRIQSTPFLPPPPDTDRSNLLQQATTQVYPSVDVEFSAIMDFNGHIHGSGEHKPNPYGLGCRTGRPSHWGTSVWIRIDVVLLSGPATRPTDEAPSNPNPNPNPNPTPYTDPSSFRIRIRYLPPLSLVGTFQ